MTLIKRIKKELEEREDRIKEANQYAYLKRQYDLATHMEENREGSVSYTHIRDNETGRNIDCRDKRDKKS